MSNIYLILHILKILVACRKSDNLEPLELQLFHPPSHFRMLWGFDVSIILFKVKYSNTKFIIHCQIWVEFVVDKVPLLYNLYCTRIRERFNLGFEGLNLGFSVETFTLTLSEAIELIEKWVFDGAAWGSKKVFDPKKSKGRIDISFNFP